MSRNSFYRLLRLTAFWFAVNFLWGGLLAIVLPSQVSFIVGGKGKAAALGTVLAAGALVAMVSQPLFGALSDRSTCKAGRRRPFMFTGALLSLVALYLMGTATNMVRFTAGFLLLQVFGNLATAGYQGLIPDTVPEELLGTASGFLGFMTFLGGMSAVIVLGRPADNHDYRSIYLIIGAVVLAGMAVTAAGVKEERQLQKQRFALGALLNTFYIHPRKHPDFAWILLCSFLILLGLYSSLNFQQYYLVDILKSAHPAQDTGWIGAVMLVGATGMSAAVGAWGDRIGRRPVFALSALCMASMAVVLMFEPPLRVILAVAVVFGLGYGGFTSVHWALATEYLPDTGTPAKDLGLWSVAATLPQVLGPKIGGSVISLVRGRGLGYTLLYGFVAVDLVLAALLIRKVRPRTKPQTRQGSFPGG